MVEQQEEIDLMIHEVDENNDGDIDFEGIVIMPMQLCLLRE